MNASGNKTVQKWMPGLIISMGIVTLVLLLYYFDMLEKVEGTAFDLRFKIKGGKDVPYLVELITIDDESLRVFGKWPWRRSLHARLIQILSEYRAKSIMFDILFVEHDTIHPEDDALLIKTARKAGNVYCPSFFPIGGIETDPEEQVFRTEEMVLPFDGLLEALKGTGYANGTPDEDGVIRKALLFTKYGGNFFPLLSFKMACDFLDVRLKDMKLKPGRYIEFASEEGGKRLKIPVTSYYNMLIHYPSDIKSYSFKDVIQSYENIKHGKSPSVPLEDFKDKVVFVGITATGSVDLQPIPLYSSYPMVGAHAAIFDTITSSQFIRHTTVLQDILIILFLGGVMGLVIPRLRPLKGVLFTLLLLILYLSGNYLLFKIFGISAIIVYPLGLIFLCDLSLTIYRYATEEKEKRWIRNIFSTYITPSVVNEILKNPDALALGGMRREMTVFFSDLADFTSISERLAPEELVRLINGYLDAMTRVIFKHQGTLDKYEGDAIMAFWNAPIDQPDHALRCCKAALECFEAMRHLQEKWGRELGLPLNMRIGINTGPMIVGNMGSSIRMDYTVMGDAVNLGARLESANKVYGTRIIMSETTKTMVENEIAYRELDALRVKGKKKPVHVYEVLALKGELSPEKEKIIQLYNQGLMCYKNRQWQKGIKYFMEVLQITLKDGPSQTYLNRCKEYLKNPPTREWDGVWELKTK